MQDKYTMLFSLAPAGLSVVPAGTCCIAFNTASNAIRELPAGRAIRPGDIKPGEYLYCVPTTPFETSFAVHGAILCVKPNGNEARPGMALNLKFHYVNCMTLQKLLVQYKNRMGRAPECITLEDVHMLLQDEMRSICERAAGEFSRNVALPYAHWWNEINYGTKYRDMLYTKMMQLFIAHGLMLDQTGFAIGSLAPITVD